MSDETDLIKERLDLADIIGEYLPLKQAGSHWKGLCPFHQEKTPSFIVSPSKGIWHCFGCSESGDVFTFVQRLEGLDFPSTLKLLAARAGVELSPLSSKPSNERTRTFELLELTARFYHEILLHQPAGQRAQAYLAERGVTPATMTLFSIGYAPAQWQTLQQFLARKGYATAEMITAGVVGKSERGQFFDRFRGRIIFPIHDIQGRVVAFGGRITPWHTTGSEGKYVNSPETAVYQKRRTVYNLHRAKPAIRQLQTCLVVEGYMDVIMLVQHGITNVVATSGTALTSEHIDQLSRFTTMLHFAFDADRAGLQASLAATHAALQAGLRVATILFPGGKDPADVALAHPDRLAEYVSQPRSLAAVMLARLKQTATASERETFLADMLPLLHHVSNPVQQGEMVQDIAATLHIPESVVIAALTKYNPAADQASPIRPAGHAATVPAAFTLEQRLLGLLILEPAVRLSTIVNLPAEMITDTATQACYRHLQTLAHDRTDFSTLPADELLNHFPPDQLPLAATCTSLCREARAASSDSAAVEISTLVRRVKAWAMERRLQSLQQAIAAQPAGDHSEALQQFQAAAEDLAELKAQ